MILETAAVVWRMGADYAPGGTPDHGAPGRGRTIESGAPPDLGPGPTMNPLSVDEVVRAYLPLIWRVLLRSGVGARDCDDVCQEVFVVYATKERSVIPGRERAFLLGVALRKASEHRRSSGRRPALAVGLPTFEGASPAPSPEQDAETRESLELVDAVLRELSPEHRDVLVLVAIEEVPLAEAALLFGVAEGTVLSRLSRAREQFKRIYRRFRLVQGGGTA